MSKKILETIKIPKASTNGLARLGATLIFCKKGDIVELTLFKHMKMQFKRIK